MDIRAITLEDINELKELHKRYFKNEFDFPDFFNNCLSSFVVTDDDGNIITGGGVRVISEAVIITDKSYPIKKRRAALIEMLRAAAFISSIKEFNQLHAFVTDPNWLRHLEKAGFKKAKGQALVIGV